MGCKDIQSPWDRLYKSVVQDTQPLRVVWVPVPPFHLENGLLTPQPREDLGAVGEQVENMKPGRTVEA